ncbi:MAG: hypothetical protein AAGJ18_24200 [Bacteroidota bacterium]
MKKLLILVVTLLVNISLFAQSETLFSNVSISGFGGPTFAVSQLNGESTIFAGGGGGAIIGNFFIGGYGEGGSLSNTTIAGEFYDLDLGYGGLWLGYSIASRKAIHPFVSVKLGSGSVDLFSVDNNRTTSSDNIQVVIPEVGIEFNFTSWMRLVTHVGYREVGGLGNGNIIDKNAVTGVTGGLTLRFGFFR